MAYELEIEDIKKHWLRATEGLGAWRTEARESYDFAASNQWTEDDIAKLSEQERPAVTFDRVGVFIDAVCGMEVNNRQAIKYFPVEQGDIRVNDTITQAVKYYENDCGAEDEDSEAVRDTVICGVGVTETVLSTDNHSDGAPCVIRRDPLKTWYDPDANRRNLADLRYFFYGDWIPEEEAEQRWPDGNFSGEMPSGQGNRAHLADKAFLYREDAQLDEKREGQVFILHYQCWKREVVYRLKDPEGGQVIDFSKKQFSAVKKLFAEKYGREPSEATKSSPQGDYVKNTKKVYYRAFVSGDDILEQGLLPTEDFTFKFITFKRDRNKRLWYGLVRTMKDPQRWANKWLSQILHIVNTNAKGGVYAETGAFADPRAAEEKWAQANPFILLKEGGIEKIKERGQAAYPSGLDKLMTFAFNALPMVSGLNLEMLGLADREQAGVVENQRKQSAYQLLAPLFAALREYRRARGKLMLKFLKFIPDDTLIRIVGKRGEQWVPFTKDQLSLTYDVKVDQAPDSPDYKKQVWESLAQILPAMMKAGYPVPPEVLNYSPLPPDVSEQWVQWIKTQGWMPPEHQAQMKQMQEQMQSLGQETMKLKEENMTLRIEGANEIAKIQVKQADGQERNAVKVYQAQLGAMTAKIDAQLRAQKDAWDAMLKAEKLKLDERMKAVETMASERVSSAQTQIKAFETVVKAQNDAEKNRQESEKRKEERKSKPVKIKRLEDGVYQIMPENG